MGWFWADTPISAVPAGAPPHHFADGRTPPPGCPMHQKSADALAPAMVTQKSATAAPGSCPVDHGQFAKATNTAAPASCPVDHERFAKATQSGAPASCPVDHGQTPKDTESKSFLSAFNPLNYMFKELSQAPAANQTVALPTSRDPSSIPKGTGDGNWEYPSPQQMYNALLRKGYTDTDITAVESMVACHNFLNEGAWAEVVGWENRFSQGLAKGFKICSRGEENANDMAYEHSTGREVPPTLNRFQGRPKDITPKATMLQVLGWLYPSKFATEPPFDRHDWFISRKMGDTTQEVRYVIDFYSGEPDENDEPVFYLDVRPAFTPLGAAERAIRWGTDVWWKASGAEVREAAKASKQLEMKQ